MKLSTFILITLLIATNSINAQQPDTVIVEQYCEVVATARLLSNRVTVNIDYGEERSIWKDYRLRDDEGKLKKFNSVIDAINYLGKEGWKLVNAFPVTVGNNPSVYHYVFKKEFLRSDTLEK